MEKIAIITGAYGQDGFYLSEYLKSKNYRVVGLVAKLREQNPRSISGTNIDEVIYFDHACQEEINSIVSRVQPGEIYNLAARTSGEAMYRDPLAVADLNGLLPARLLEAIKALNPKIRLFQASSREVFGDAHGGPQNEGTARRPRNPYGAAKLYADNMVEIYRNQYGIFACSGILYNHESPRRPNHFVTKKVAKAAAEISLGLTERLHLGDISASRDWGYSGDFVKAMWLMLQQNHAEDYVLASGVVHTIEQLCDIAFTSVNLDFRDYVVIDSKAVRPPEAGVLVGDITKARNQLGWSPETPFSEMIKRMVQNEIDILENTRDQY